MLRIAICDDVEGNHCSVCSEVLAAQRTIPATGHIKALAAAVTPTCPGERERPVK